MSQVVMAQHIARQLESGTCPALAWVRNRDRIRSRDPETPRTGEHPMLRNTRKGFTLIELLIVVVIIGILAAIAIPKFASTKEKAYLATMKSDLRNLATAQEGYFADNKAYMAGDATNPGTGTPTGTMFTSSKYAPSTGVTVVA